MSSLDTTYDQSQEPDIYKKWEDSGFFNPDNLPAPSITSHPRPTERHQSFGRVSPHTYSIIMPPPNANGHLHAGHAMFVTIEDIMTRYARMTGKRALWLPGADHAGFETQVVYEKKLEKEGRSRFEMSRDELYKEILAFTLENKKHMESELRALGASCDWSREKFTLDENVIKAVHRTFKQMFEDGLIYRGTRIVSWCAKHQTSFSDLEIEDVEREDPLYYLQYGPFEIATARPETKFGDKYVVVHPDDPRYAKYKDGEKIELEWINGSITATVIKDAAIDMEFGTGAMTITPWHDATDFEIAERHGLEKQQIIDLHGRLLPVAGEFAGMKIAEARTKIVEKLKEKGLLVRVDEKYKHVVRTCYKCGNVIEPQIKEQWFVKTKPLAERAIKAIEKEEVKFVPEHYKKICLHWLENIIDWNISRQIAWGIRIPAWFCLGCGKPQIAPEVKSKWFLVRHGETDFNKEGRALGTSDIPLNETGRVQAQKAGDALFKEHIDLIISSDLSRARETAEIISKKTGAPIVIDPDLRERYHGKAEGLGYTAINELYPNFYQTYEGKLADNESYKELEERIANAFEKHKTEHHPKNVVIVAHSGPIRTLLRRIKNWSIEHMFSLPVFPNAVPIPLDILSQPCACGSDLAEQDPDVFDTWFSSGQWPFIALGYPDGRDFKDFYPTDVMETSGDIIFFWVTRMIMFGLYVTGKVPFKTVYLHGLVLDAKGQKMSKSKGNVINPLDLTSKYGTDALRMALVVGNTPGTSLALAEDRVRGYRNFSTKIWNVLRFVIMNRPEDENAGASSAGPSTPLGTSDEKNLAELREVRAEVAKHIENFEFHLGAEKAYHYVWHTFADKIIEEAKPRLQGMDAHDKAAAHATLVTILAESLKMLHPFMPFVTEAAWGKLVESGTLKLPDKECALLMVQEW